MTDEVEAVEGLTTQFVVTEQEAEPLSVSGVAQAVVAGHWGRGNDRRRRLVDAGLNPDEVQAEVNKILNK